MHESPVGGRVCCNGNGWEVMEPGMEIVDQDCKEDGISMEGVAPQADAAK